MPVVKLAVGAEVDIASSEEIAELHRAIDAKADAFLHRDAKTMTATSTTAPSYLDLGTPDDGWVWDVRKVVFSHQNANGAATPAPYDAANVTPVGVYVVGGSMAPVTTDLVDVATVEPVAFGWSKGEMILNPGEHLYLGVIAPANPTLYVATIRAIRSRDRNRGRVPHRP